MCSSRVVDIDDAGGSPTLTSKRTNDRLTETVGAPKNLVGACAERRDRIRELAS